MDNIGKCIRDQRVARGWSQEELARKMGYSSATTLSRIENGYNGVPYSKIVRFAEVFGMSVEDMVSYNSNGEQPPDFACSKSDAPTSVRRGGAPKGHSAVMRENAFRKRNIVADRLREAMRLANKTQSALARETGVSQSSISKYLLGENEPKAETAYLFAKSLDVNVGWLLGKEVPRERMIEQPDDSKYIMFAVVVEKLLKMDAEELKKISGVIDLLENNR